MKAKIDNSTKAPDTTQFPQLRFIDDLDDTYIYLFYSDKTSVCLSHSDIAVRTADFDMTEYYTGSLTLENN